MGTIVPSRSCGPWESTVVTDRRNGAGSLDPAGANPWRLTANSYVTATRKWWDQLDRVEQSRHGSASQHIGQLCDSLAGGPR